MFASRGRRAEARKIPQNLCFFPESPRLSEGPVSSSSGGVPVVEMSMHLLKSMPVTDAVSVQLPQSIKTRRGLGTAVVAYMPSPHA